jgi:tetratricopeptide (TPR) repeat protein
MLRTSIVWVILALVAVVVSWMPVRDTDAWYHLAAGEWILTNLKVPLTDSWSFTAHGERWITHEWMYEAVIASCYRLGGLVGVVLFKVVLVFAILLALERLSRHGRGPLAFRVAVVAFAAFLAARRLTDRPQLVTFLCTAMALNVLETWARRSDSSEGAWRSLWPLLPIYWFWGNCHGGVVYGYGILFCYWVDAVVRMRRAGERRPGVAGRTAMPMLAAFVVSIANPNHVFTALYPFLLIRRLAEAGFTTFELKPAALMAGHWQQWAIALVMAAWIIACRVRPLREVLLICGIGGSALWALREQAYFCLVVAPFLAIAIPELARRYPGVKWPRATRLVLGAVACGLWFAITAAVWIRPPFWTQPVRSEDPIMPGGIVEFHRRHNLPVCVFNSHAWGGYLVWKSKERIKPFIDARLDVFPAEVLRDYLSIEFDKPNRRDLMKEYEVDCALLDYTQFYSAVASNIHGIRRNLFGDSDWALVHWDDSGTIFVRKEWLNANRPDLRIWETVNPDVPDLDYLTTQGDVLRAVDELRKHSALQPDCARSKRLLATALLRTGDIEGAIKQYRSAAESDRAAAADWHGISFCLDEQGKLPEAEDVALEGLDRFPDSVLLLDLLGIVLAKQGREAEGAESLERAAEIGPPSYEREINLSIMYTRLGKPESAQEHDRKAGKLRQSAQ